MMSTSADDGEFVETSSVGVPASLSLSPFTATTALLRPMRSAPCPRLVGVNSCSAKASAPVCETVAIARPPKKVTRRFEFVRRGRPPLRHSLRRRVMMLAPSHLRLTTRV